MLQLTLVFEGWPLRGLGRFRAGLLALVISWAVALAALNFMGGLIILHVAIWRRWPLLNKRERDASRG